MENENMDVFSIHDIDLNDIEEQWCVKVNMLGEIFVTNDKEKIIVETSDLNEAIEYIEQRIEKMIEKSKNTNKK